jgi:hypothetical protein
VARRADEVARWAQAQQLEQGRFAIYAADVRSPPRACPTW